MLWTFSYLTDYQNMPANYDAGVYENCDGNDE